MIKTNKELEQKNDQIENQKKILGKVNKELLDKNEQLYSSMRYAEKIQRSFIPGWKYFKARYPDSFLPYKPRDIVSSDFYWFGENDEFFYAVVADFTGHGIPGSLLTMMGIMALNEAIEHLGIKECDKILEYLDKSVTDNLTSDDEFSMNDGMDISLLAFSKIEDVIHYSGAYRPLV